jgi:hypothetical protein
MDYYNKPKYTISNALLEEYCTNYKPPIPPNNYYGTSSDYYSIQPFYHTNKSSTSRFSIDSSRIIYKKK